MTGFHQRGFTYFGLLFVVALIGLALSGAALVWHIIQQREKENELLFIGQQYVDAIASYYHAAPGGIKKYPRSISDLLRDSRYLTIKRHLRKPWRDPLTGSKQWGLVLTKQGGIAGIYSLAKGTPVKQKGFGMLESLLADKTNYQEWRFIYIAASDTALPTNTPANAENDEAVEGGSDTESEEETGAELLDPEQKE